MFGEQVILGGVSAECTSNLNPSRRVAEGESEKRGHSWGWAFLSFEVSISRTPEQEMQKSHIVNVVYLLLLDVLRDYYSY